MTGYYINLPLGIIQKSRRISLILGFFLPPIIIIMDLFRPNSMEPMLKGALQEGYNLKMLMSTEKQTKSNQQRPTSWIGVYTLLSCEYI